MGAALKIPVRHTDDLVGKLDWSAGSAEVARWLDMPGDWVIEGVSVVRALRKWLLAHPVGLPHDKLVYLRVPHEKLTEGQRSMTKGHDTIWASIETILAKRQAHVR